MRRLKPLHRHGSCLTTADAEGGEAVAVRVPDDPRTRPPEAQAIALEHKSLAKLQKLGVKVVTNVDKASFIKIAEPLQEKLAKSLGPHAEKILQICRSIE